MGEHYHIEELCDLLSLIQITMRDPAEGSQNLPITTVEVLLQHPFLMWPGHDGLNRRVQWITINKGDIRNRIYGVQQLEKFSDWRSQSGLTPLPCTLRPSEELLTHATSGQQLIEVICHCAEHPDTARLDLPNRDDTAQVNDAVARFFLQLFPTIFVALFRGLLNQQQGETESDVSKLWELSCVASEHVASHQCSESEHDHGADLGQASAAQGAVRSRPDAEADIFEDHDLQAVNTADESLDDQIPHATNLIEGKGTKRKPAVADTNRKRNRMAESDDTGGMGNSEAGGQSILPG